MLKNKKHKYFPYGHFSKQVIGYCPRTRQPVYEYKHAIPIKKPFLSGYARVIIIFFLLCVAMALMGCSNAPIVDSRGKSSANINGDMNRYHDDLYTCEDIVKDNTNVVADKGKIVYNSFRWRILWLSPKLNTRQDLVNNCLEGRGYNVLNK
jgi:hypothetical protein|tara:strand:- start:247 stop:699 length:453 start_codon:yes stop_codon:yes gene_type:complete